MPKIVVNPKPVYPVEALDSIISRFPHLRGEYFREAETEIDNWYKRGGHHYSIRDWRILDYNACIISGVDYPVYGNPPELVEPGEYFSVLGSAHSAGVCSLRSYVDILSSLSHLPSINLSRGGNSPELIARDNLESCSQYLPSSKFVVFEIMSVRSASNSRFTVTTGDMAYDHQMSRPDGTRVSQCRPMDIYKMLMRNDPNELHRLISESSENYIRHAEIVIKEIESPIIFLWLSQRVPDFFDISDIPQLESLDHTQNIARFQNSFPMFTGRWLCERMLSLAKSRGLKCALIEVSCSTGLGSLAVNRFTNETTKWWNGESKQSYYPSLYMHNLAAARINRCVQELGLN
jgi:hypothetical protein